MKHFSVTFNDGSNLKIQATSQKIAVWIAQVKANKDGGDREIVMIQTFFPEQKFDRFNELTR